jgi:hypothetical protein
MRKTLGSLYIGVSAAFVALLSASHFATGQTVFTPPASNNLRPAVLMQFPAQAGITAAAAQNVAVGIFDSGDPENTLSEETTTLINPGFLAADPNPATPPPPIALTNMGRVGGLPASATQFAVTVATNVNGSGFLGATLTGPELTVRAKQPAHIFTTVTNMTQADPLNRGNYQNPVEYYNSQGSENHLGDAFVSAAPGGGTRLAAEVDPTNAMVLPFAYDNAPTDITQANGNALLGASNPLDMQTSSVSFLAANDPRTPTFPLSNNPGNTFRVALTPTNFNGGAAVAAFNSANTDTGYTDSTDGASIAPLPFINGILQNIPGGGAAVAGNYLVDTGAPSTGVPHTVYTQLAGYNAATPNASLTLPSLQIPMIGGGTLTFNNVSVTDNGTNGILGTNILNMFGQFFNYQTNELDLEAVKSNVLFAVNNGSALGLSHTGVNQAARFGAAGTAGSEVFRSSQSGSNALFVNNTAVDLQAGDQIDGLSAGNSIIGNPIAFSVSSTTTGKPGTAVATQAGLNQQAGDIFVSNGANPSRSGSNPGFGTNSLYINPELLGLGVGGNAVTRTDEGPAGNVAGVQDQIGGFVLNAPRTINPVQSTGATAGSITSTAQMSTDTTRLFYTLAPSSPSLTGGLNSSDIFVSNGANSLSLFANGQTTMGLLPGDVISAIALNDQGNPNALDPGQDLALFTLAFNSPTLVSSENTINTADVFETNFNGTFSLYASSDSLGLNFGDQIDGLDTVVPEPGTAALLALAPCLLMLRLRRRHCNS